MFWFCVVVLVMWVGGVWYGGIGLCVVVLGVFVVDG